MRVTYDKATKCWVSNGKVLISNDKFSYSDVYFDPDRYLMQSYVFVMV